MPRPAPLHCRYKERRKFCSVRREEHLHQRPQSAQWGPDRPNRCQAPPRPPSTFGLPRACLNLGVQTGQDAGHMFAQPSFALFLVLRTGCGRRLQSYLDMSGHEGHLSAAHTTMPRLLAAHTAGQPCLKSPPTSGQVTCDGALHLLMKAKPLCVAQSHELTKGKTGERKNTMNAHTLPDTIPVYSRQPEPLSR